jgi:hypothetical protein
MLFYVKLKVNFIPEQVLKVQKRNKVISRIVSTRSSMKWVVNAIPWPLYPRETGPVLIIPHNEWSSRPVWTGAVNLDPPGFDLWTVQSVVSRYTDSDVPSHSFSIQCLIEFKFNDP